MTADKERLEYYMFRTHSRAELREWGNALRFFRFCRAVGGMANDGDTYVAALGFRDLDELHALCRGLGFSLTPLPPDEPRLAIGQSPAPGQTFRNPIREYPLWEQPGQREIGGASVSLSVYEGRLYLTLYGEKYYDVEEGDVDRAKRIEAALAPVAHAIVDPPVDSERCLSPSRYPKFFAGSTTLE